MAALPLDDCDGIFIERDTTLEALDEVDSSRVFEIVREKDIPMKYFLHKIFSPMLDSMHSFQRRSEQPSRYRLIHKDWGHRLNPLRESGGVLALISLENGTLNDSHSRGVAKHITGFLKEHKCEPISWDLTHLTMYFSKAAGYESLGQAFLDGKLDDCEGFKVTKVEPALLCNPPKALVEHESHQVADLQACLTDVVLPFSSAFSFTLLHETLTVASGNNSHVNNHDDETSPTKRQKVETLTPSLCLTMLFDGSNQGHAQRALKHLNRSPWQPVKLSDEVSKVIDAGLEYFINKDYSTSMWGIKTGCPQAGVQLVVFVDALEKFTPMEEFYKMITGLEPFRRDITGSDVRYSVYALSQRAELVLAHYPALSPGRPQHCALAVQVNNTNHIPGTVAVDTDRWQVYDPEGNKVILYSVLK